MRDMRDMGHGDMGHWDMGHGDMGHGTWENLKINDITNIFKIGYN